jgi:uncharacterized protein
MKETGLPTHRSGPDVRHPVCPHARHRPHRHTRLTVSLTLITAALLAGCAAGTADRLLHLRAAPPVSVSAGSPAPLTGTEVWLVQYPIKLPDYLDRDSLLLREGDAGLQRVPGYRWAEALRDSVPRLLRADLATLLGEARVWTVPLPAGVQPTRQLRLEVLAFEADAAQRQVMLQARWSLAWADGSRAPLARAATLEVPVAGTGADALAAAHRLAVWQLAERIAQTR